MQPSGRLNWYQQRQKVHHPLTLADNAFWIPIITYQKMGLSCLSSIYPLIMSWTLQIWCSTIYQDPKTSTENIQYSKVYISTLVVKPNPKPSITLLQITLLLQVIAKFQEGLWQACNLGTLRRWKSQKVVKVHNICSYKGWKKISQHIHQAQHE